MRASKGGLSHSEIMQLTWRQFWVYVDAFIFLLREESEEGRKENKTDDLRAMVDVPELKKRKRKLLEDTKRDVAKHKKFAESNPSGGTVRNLLE
jgi:hypothetical protein